MQYDWDHNRFPVAKFAKKKNKSLISGVVPGGEKANYSGLAQGFIEDALSAQR